MALLNDATMKILAQQDVGRLNQFDGTNYTRWKDKMKFLLSTVKVFYVLDANLSPLPAATPEDTEEQKAERGTRENDELTCRGLILNSLTDRLYDLYSPLQTPLEIWTALETKYQNEKRGTDKFLALNYFDFKMTEDKPIMDQVHELQILVSRLKDLEVVIPDAFQIGAILSKLPLSWNNYRKKFLQQSGSFTMEQFQTHLQIECETRIRDEKMSKDKDNAESSMNKTQIHMVGAKSGNKSEKSKNLKANNNTGFKKNSKKEKTCYHCGKKGHFIKECRYKKKENKKSGSSSNTKTNEANVMEIDEDFVAVITEVNAVSAANSDFFIDSGATVHICNNKDLFNTYVEEDSEVFMGNQAAVRVFGKGSIVLNFTSGQKLTLINVYHVPDVKRNLVSASLLVKRGFKILLESDKVVITKNGVFVGKGYSLDGLFKLSINEMKLVSLYIDSLNVVESSNLWHARLGHLNYATLKYMTSHDYFNCKHDYVNKCEICAQAKITRKPFPKANRETQILDLVHTDICELNGKLTRGGKRYFITFIDDCSRYIYVHLLRTKDEAFEAFKEFKAKVENQKERKIKVLRSDRGGEYFPDEFNKYCEEHGIIHQRTAPFTPQHNGLAERKNRTLVDMVNSMILNAKLPFNLWGEALLTSCHLINRIPSKKIHTSPYEIWNGRKPNIKYFKVWGCVAYYRLPDSQRKKLGSRGIKSIFVGYPQNSKAYRLLDLESNVIVESIHVEFFENTFVQDNIIYDGIDIPHSTENQNNIPTSDPSSSKRKELEEPLEPRRSQRQRKEKIDPDFITFFVEGSRKRLLKTFEVCNIDDDPKTLKEALASRDAAFWQEAVNDEMDSIMANGTWVLVDLPPGSKPIKNKWVFRRKYNSDGSVQTFKARLVAKGFTQKKGIDYFDTYSPVASITSIRVLFALASFYKLYIHQMDVKTAFLNGNLKEEVYMEQPEGFILLGNENKVCKLVKSLYGLKQAPKQWHEKFDTAILSFGFRHNTADKCIYSKFTNEYGVIICLYVDDMLIFGTNMIGINETKKFLMSTFKMKDLKEVDMILGIKVIKHDNGFMLSQTHYIEKLLNKFNFLKIREYTTPYDSSITLVKNDARSIEQLKYASAIGSLMYAMHCTRPDIAYAVSKLSRFTHNPSVDHWKAIERVFGYLKHMSKLKLCYSKFPMVLEGYSDASWIKKLGDNNSTSGWIFTIAGGAISWASKKQTCLAHSTMESEFIALASAGKEAEWIRNMLLEIDLWPQPMPPITIHCDSEATMSNAFSNVYNGKSRHISLRHDYIRELISNGTLTISYIKSAKNLSDPLTKALPRDKVWETTSGMGLKYNP